MPSNVVPPNGHMVREGLIRILSMTWNSMLCFVTRWDKNSEFQLFGQAIRLGQSGMLLLHQDATPIVPCQVIEPTRTCMDSMVCWRFRLIGETPRRQRMAASAKRVTISPSITRTQH